MKLFGCRGYSGRPYHTGRTGQRCDMATDVLRHLYDEALEAAAEALTNLYGCMVMGRAADHSVSAVISAEKIRRSMKGLSRLEKQWVLYDVGNSAFVMLCTTIIPIYFKNIATGEGISLADSTAYLSYALSVCTILVALMGPVFGNPGRHKRI